MVLPAPAFQESSTCSACGCTFNLIRRKHHCRQCGGTFCAEHSSKTRPLPQYGLDDPVRVCEDCFSRPDDSDDSSDIDSEQRAAIMDNLGEGSDLGPGGLTPASPISPSNFSGNDVDTNIGWGTALGRKSDNRASEANTATLATPSVVECTCGMPLCICAQSAPAPAAEPLEIQARPGDSQRAKEASDPPVQQKPVAVQRTSTDASSSGLPSLFFTSSAAQGSKSGPSSRDGYSTSQSVHDYEPSEEGVREAIMKGDLAAVTALMSRHTLDPNYMDGNNMTLLHVATMFNRTDVVFALLQAGADPTIENGQGETALDCAPAMLQAKIRAHLAKLQQAAPAQ